MPKLEITNFINTIEDRIRERGAPIGAFWHWLGNVRFPEDNGHLTESRMAGIMADIDKHLDAFERVS